MNARTEPNVLFPVFWPEGSPPPDVAGWVFASLRGHIHYAQAVVEIARRNGGGGFLRVELGPERHPHTHDGKPYVWSMATAEWDRGVLELSPGVDRPGELRAGPTQKRFTAQVLVPNGTPTPDKATALVECDAFHAAALRKLEAAGLNETTGVVAALDGGAT